MDSLRKKQQEQEQYIEVSTTITDAPKPFSKREDLFISKEENAKYERAEKNFHKMQSLKKSLTSLIILILIFALAYFGFFFWKAHIISKQMNIGQNKNSSFTQDIKSTFSSISSQRKLLAGENEGRINILMLGAAGQHDAGKNLTDTIMIMSINTNDKKVALLSIPRDLYVQIPSINSYTKINSLYSYGLQNNVGAELILQSVEKITGLNIQYYVIANYDGFKEIVDDLNGINVTVDRDIYDSRYPGPNFSYETFEIKKGFHEMNGETALKFVRERHDDPQGDFGRAQRQQKVLQAMKNKMFSLQTFFNITTLNNILDTVGSNIKTNISFDEMESLIILAKQVDTQNISNVVIDAWKKDSILKVSHVEIGQARAFILIPRVGNYSEIQETAKDIFNNDLIKKRQMEIANEHASVNIINNSGNSGLAIKIRDLLTDKLLIKNAHITYSNSNVAQELTLISDNSAKQKLYTLDELIKKLPAILVNTSQQDTDEKYDLTITLGKDLVDLYKYDEANIDEFNKAQDDQFNF